MSEEHRSVREVFARPVFGSAETTGATGVWAVERGAGVLSWSDNLFRIFGLEPGGAVPSPELVDQMTLAPDRQWVRERVADLDEAGRFRPFDHRIRRADGELRYLHVRPGPDEADGAVMVGVVHDVTDVRRREIELAVRGAVGVGLADWRSLRQGGPVLLRRIGDALGAAAGVMWSPDGDALRVIAMWPGAVRDEPLLPPSLERARVAHAAGPAGMAWAELAPASTPAGEPDRRFAHQRGPGVGGAVAIPTSHDAQVLAVLELFFPPGEELDPALLDPLAVIGRETGLFLHGRRGELARPVLTEREREVLQLSARGWTGPEIAVRLSVSHATVRTHFENIYEKYSVSGRAAAVAEALRQGVID